MRVRQFPLQSDRNLLLNVFILIDEAAEEPDPAAVGIFPRAYPFACTRARRSIIPMQFDVFFLYDGFPVHT